MADIDRLPEVRLAEAMPVRDRLAIYRDAVCRSLVSLSVDIPDGDRFTAYVRATPLGVLRMTEVQSKPQLVRRTPASSMRTTSGTSRSGCCSPGGAWSRSTEGRLPWAQGTLSATTRPPLTAS